MKTDFQKLFREILGRVIKKLDTQKSILFGKTKIYYKQEVGTELDEKYLEWIKFKGIQATKIQK